MELAIFDFDGTITTKDTFIQFIKYAVGSKKFAKGIIALRFYLLLYYMKIIPEGRIKELMITYFFKDWPEEKFKNMAEDFAKQRIPDLLRKSAVDRIQWHQKNLHQVFVVSASIDYWIQPWCDLHDIGLIATRLEVKDNKITGRFATKDCDGAEKLKRLKQALDLSQFSCIHVYGNSRGDKEILKVADKSYYRCFT